MAVEKERDSRLEELRSTELELERVKDERDSLISGNNTELDGKEKENERLRNLVNKFKRVLSLLSIIFNCFIRTPTSPVYFIRVPTSPLVVLFFVKFVS